MKGPKSYNAIGSLILQVVLTGISAMIPYGYKLILDNYTKAGQVLDHRLIILIMFTGILSYLLNLFFVSYWQEKFIVSEGVRYQKDNFVKIIKMPQHGYEKLGNSFLINSIMVDGEETARYHFIRDVQIKGYVVNGVILFLILLFINPLFATISLGGTLIYYILLKFSKGNLEQRNNSVMESQDNFMNDIKHYTVNNTAIIKSENAGFFEGKFTQTIDTWIKNKLSLAFLQSIIDKIPVAISMTLPLVILYLGALDIKKGTMTLGTLMMFIQIQELMFTPVNKASNAMAKLSILKTHKDRVDKLSTEFKEQGVISSKEKGIKIKDTSIKTPDGRLLFEGSINIGQKGFYIVKGGNGTGKSTLLRGIIGNLSPDQVDGSIYINESLINGMAFLKYPLFLFKSNVVQNIIGAPGLESNIKVEDISKFNPPDMEKYVELDPLNLSSGEAQKVVLLRELSKDSNMIFLDEPTTNLDKEVVSELKDYINREKENRLIVSIMHDDSFDSIADGFIDIKDNKLGMVKEDV